MKTLFNPDFSVKSYKDPFKFWVVDGIFQKDLSQDVLNVWPNLSDARWNKGYLSIGGHKNKLEDKMMAMSGKRNMPTFFKNFIKTLNSHESIAVYEKITGIKNLKVDDNWRWAGLRETLPGGHQLVHSDARKHPENGLRKELTLLFYFREDYDRKRDEGCLEMWNDDMTQMIHEVEPIHNRMVIFLNTDQSYHGVPVTKANRKMITFSLLKEGETTERFKALFLARPDDDPVIDELGLERLRMKDNFY
jgi:hypothetical protein